MEHQKHKNLKQKMVLHLLFVGFAACFLFQVLEQVVKFLGKETVNVSRDKPDENLRFPTLTVCPFEGFRSAENVDLTGSKDLRAVPYEEHLGGNLTRTEIDDLWEDMTFSLSEMLHSVSLYTGGTAYTVANFSQIVNSVEIGSPGSGEILSVSELGSFQFGRCALIRSSIVIDQTYRTWVTVLSDFGGTLIFFASEDGPNELGVTLDHWGRWPFSTFKLEPGLETRIAVQKTIDDSDSQVAACSEAVSTIDTTNCFKATLKSLMQDGEEFCYLPQIKEATSGLPLCSSKEQALSTHWAYLQGKVGIESDLKCEMSCRLEGFDVTVRERVLNPLGGPSTRAKVGMYFTTDMVRHTRQLVLYDLSTIVASVGGSMGMFLGFSCLHFCRKWLEWFLDKLPGFK